MSKTKINRYFVAETHSPERLRLHLSLTGIRASRFGSFEGRGWELVVSKLTPAGDEEVFRDHWDETLLEIFRYFDNYTKEPLQWRSEESGELVDLRKLQPALDESTRYATAVRTVVSPGGDQRLCFNLFDDGYYRFTREEVIREGGLSVWIARQWSSEHATVEDAETEARNACPWFT